jgi:hypothetical protein
MVEEDKDESPHVNADETDEEAQDTCPALDDDLDHDVDDITIEKGDCVFMTMVHLVDPHHFVCASIMVSGCLAEAFAKNSKPKDFHDIVPMSLHTYTDIFTHIHQGLYTHMPRSLHTYTNIFSKTAFDSLPECRK